MHQPDPVIPSAADLKQVLTLVLGEDAEQALPFPALLHWASAPGTQAPPVRIDESMVAVQNIAHLTADQYPVMQYLHQQGAFTSDGWLHFTQKHPDLASASGLYICLALLASAVTCILANTHLHSSDMSAILSSTPSEVGKCKQRLSVSGALNCVNLNCVNKWLVSSGVHCHLPMPSCQYRATHIKQSMCVIGTSDQNQGSKPKRRRRDPCAPSAAAMKQVLTLVLGETGGEPSPLMGWADSVSHAQPPPIRVDETLVDVTSISLLTSEQYPVMGYLHRRGVFTGSGWQQFTHRHPELLLPTTGDALGTWQYICT